MGTPKARFLGINFVALIAAGLFLASVFLFWWGIDATGTFSESFRWSLWSGPSRIYINSGETSSILVTDSPAVGGLVIASAVLAVLGTIPRASRLLIGSSVLAIAAPVLYTAIVNTAISDACNGMSQCISGPFGTQTFSAGPFSQTVNWGFQLGFYLEIVGTVFSIIAIAFQRTFLTKAP